MNQEMQPVFEIDAMKVAVGSTPDPEVAALPKRRQFLAAYKRRIVREANACQVPGEVGVDGAVKARDFGGKCGRDRLGRGRDVRAAAM